MKHAKLSVSEAAQQNRCKSFVFISCGFGDLRSFVDKRADPRRHTKQINTEERSHAAHQATKPFLGQNLARKTKLHRFVTPIKKLPLKRLLFKVSTDVSAEALTGSFLHCRFHGRIQTGAAAREV